MKRIAPEPVRLRAALAMALLAAGAAGLAGCESLGAAWRAPITQRQGDEGGQALAARFETLRALVEGDATAEAAIVAARRNAFEATHTAAATLDYAIVLATPGHAAQDPAAARALLQTALAQASTLGATERALAVFFLALVDDQLGREAETQRKVDSQAAGHTATARRLLAEIEENARLRRALDDARTKLDAVTAIERGKR